MAGHVCCERWGRRRVGFALRVAVAGLAAFCMGCGRSPEVRYTPRAEVQTLKPELQQQIAHLLEQHCGSAQSPKVLGNETISVRHLLHGRDVYQKRCVQCHGVTGDGAGPAAAVLYPKPRDYRRGLFKFTSTPYGAKPRRDDLVRTVRRGISGTSMPSFQLLEDRDLNAVVDYVMFLTHRGEFEFLLVNSAGGGGDTLDPDDVAEILSDIREAWAKADAEVVHPLTPEPQWTHDHVVAGRQAFLTRGCSKCHGEDGRGQTPDNLRGDLKDAWGHVTRAADLTSGMLHGGREPVDVYRRIFSGINGTPMPAFKSSLAQEPETVWNLVAYVLHVSNERRRGRIPEAGEFAPPARPSADRRARPEPGALVRVTRPAQRNPAE